MDAFRLAKFDFKCQDQKPNCRTIYLSSEKIIVSDFELFTQDSVTSYEEDQFDSRADAWSITSFHQYLSEAV